MSVGWVTPNKPGLLGFLEGKRLGAVNAQGTSAHFLPGSFPGQKACRLFGFRFSMNRRGSYGIDLPLWALWSREMGVAASSTKRWVRTLGQVTHGPPLRHSFLHLPDPSNLGSTGGWQAGVQRQVLSCFGGRREQGQAGRVPTPRMNALCLQ